MAQTAFLASVSGLVLLAGLAACSNTVDVLSDSNGSSSSGSGAQGAASSGTGGGSGGAAAGTGGSTTTTGTGAGGGCDHIEQGGPCFPDGLSCSFNTTCGNVEAACLNGTWQFGVPLCPPAPCPTTPPANGSSCSGYLASQTCYYNACVTATCQQNLTWSVVYPPTQCAIPCGPNLTCFGGDVCVTWVGSPPSYACAPYPCAPEDLSCSCAGVLCQVPLACTAASNGQVSCDSCTSCK